MHNGLLHPPHLLVVHDVHAVGPCLRADPRPVVGQRPLEVRLAVARLPRPHVAHVVHCRRERVALDVPPLGDKGKDRLVVPMLSEGGVLRDGEASRGRGQKACESDAPEPPLTQTSPAAIRIRSSLPPRGPGTHHDACVERGGVEHGIRCTQRERRLALCPAPVGEAWEVERGDALRSLLAEAEERRGVVRQHDIVVNMHENIALRKLAQLAQHVIRLPAPPTGATSAIAAYMRSPPVLRQVFQRPAAAGVDGAVGKRRSNPRITRPALLRRRARKPAVRAEGAQVPSCLLPTDCLVPCSARQRAPVARMRPVVDARAAGEGR
eukprot:scaffold110015_cov36-Tisochrysis_lutea.AAC.3